ncbi:hypothetical protein CDAR_105881 [Caerostris darwini]|uniref:Uncharacterized protein n=1 Tax=Caerostris darwini TaxID=1538125 RepID=A0AAV4TP57_9ARAC|nr:hypothetical protein CDAR_105881 [Caerostris darwini]
MTSLSSFQDLQFKIVCKPSSPLFPYTLPSLEEEESHVPVQVEGEISLCKSRKPLNCALDTLKARGREKDPVFKIISHKPNQLSVFDNDFSFPVFKTCNSKSCANLLLPFPPTPYQALEGGRIECASAGERGNFPMQIAKPLNCAVRFSYAKMCSSEFEGLLYCV